MTTAALEPPAGAGAEALPAAPYRGIEPFRYVDRPIFFAREAETRRLLRSVAVYRGVLFYGDSGSGKSSLVNAGFIPAIAEEGFTPDRLRVQPRPGEEIVVERISRSPDGGAPFLPSNFVGDGGAAARVVIPAAALRGRLAALPEGRRPLLIFDQFEEFATLFEAVPRGDAVRQAQEAQEAILKAVVGLLRDPALPVKLLFVFREDYLAKLNKLVALFPDLSDQYLRLTPPATSALPEIIRGSFERFPGRFGKELSEDLTAKLSAAIEERSEGGRLNLSEVQIACLELWKSESPAALFERKGVRGLLESHLSDSLNALPLKLRDPALALLGHMVTASGARNVISAEDLISLASNDEKLPRPLLGEALAALERDTRLVRRELRRETYFYEIVSEFLIPWISDQRAERTERRAAERERRKRRKAYALAGAGLALALAVLAGALYIKRRADELVEVRTQRAIATERVQRAEQKAEEYQGRNESLLQSLLSAESRAAIHEAIEASLARDAQADAKKIKAWEAAGSPNPFDWPSPDRPPTAQERRQGITIHYAPDGFDPAAAEARWSALGFSARSYPPEGARPDTLLCGSEVGAEDVKKVAYTLMLLGVRITKVEPGGRRQLPTTIRLTRSGVSLEHVGTTLENELGLISEADLRRISALPDGVCNGN